MDLEALKAELRDASPEDVDAVRIAAISEQERRAKLEQLPDGLAGMARDAAAAGCDRDELLERVADALTTDEETAP